MATLPNQIKITELDYDQILQNLIAFMKTDPTFADYDFTGSGLRLLSRVLAYVTFYNNYYVSSAVNESFLDTAQLRSSIASHARMLGYEIKGSQSASAYANVEITIGSSSASTLTLPRMTQFVFAGNTQFTFYNLEDAQLVVDANTGVYKAANVLLTEGRPLTFQFTVDLTNPTQRFIIPNGNVDYRTITVQVQASVSANTITNFLPVTNYLTIGPTDPVFFTEEASGGFPEITFGNGNFGLALEQGNIVIVGYLVTRGTLGNGVRGPFRIPTANIAGFTSGVTVVDDATVSTATGGSAPEDPDQVRFLAPLQYQSQNRCVTVQDYKTVILREYGEHISAINVFGEQGDPNDVQERPIFGKVFIAVKPNVGLQFTEIARSFIENQIIRPRNVVGIIPEVIDPDYVYIVPSSLVKYDPTASTRSKLDLQSAIAASIQTYAEQNIEKFDTSFRFSRLTRVIDDTDEAILSSLTRLDLEKRFFPKLGVRNQFILKFRAALRKNGNDSAILESIDHRFDCADLTGVVHSNCFLLEQNGVIAVGFRDAMNQISIVNPEVGNIDVTTGLVTINNFVPLAIENGESDIRVRVTPVLNDFTPRLNQLFTIDDTDINVILVVDGATIPTEQLAFFTAGLV